MAHRVDHWHVATPCAPHTSASAPLIPINVDGVTDTTVSTSGSAAVQTGL
jgi:hypothetical protein